MPNLRKKSDAHGFTVVELIVTIVLIVILVVVASPHLLDFNADARGARIKGIAASIQSAIDLSSGKAVIAGVDKQNKMYIDLDGDGEAEGIPFNYGQPIIVGSIALNEITNIDMCVADDDTLPHQTLCSDENHLMGQVTVEGIQVHYTLTDSSATGACRINIANAWVDIDGNLISTTVSFKVDGC